jgi:hypothetical protein
LKDDDADARQMIRTMDDGWQKWVRKIQDQQKSSRIGGGQ